MMLGRIPEKVLAAQTVLPKNRLPEKSTNQSTLDEDMTGVAIAPPNPFHSFLRKLTILGSTTILLAIATVLVPYPAKLIFQVFLGMMFAHSIELQHELTHHILFPNERINRAVGIVLGIPMLVSFSRYKAMHGHHHMALGTPADQESFNYSYETLTSPVGFLSHLSMLGHYEGVLRNLSAAILGKTRESFPVKISRRVCSEFRLIATIVISIILISIVCNTVIFVNLWLVPLVFFAGPIHALIELPEHLGCDRETSNSFQNTRTIRAGKLITWFVNGNNYHVEHHLNAALPIDQLAQFHRQIAPQIQHLESSYWAFYRKLWRDLWR